MLVDQTVKVLNVRYHNITIKKAKGLDLLHLCKSALYVFNTISDRNIYYILKMTLNKAQFIIVIVLRIINVRNKFMKVYNFGNSFNIAINRIFLTIYSNYNNPH